MLQTELVTSLPPLASVYIPPLLLKEAQAIAAEDIHPAWKKMERKGNHFIVKTDSLDDLTEIADWARTALVEPEKPLGKAHRQAYATLIQRVERWAVIDAMEGTCHCWAIKWKR
jgi:hypothetical protein